MGVAMTAIVCRGGTSVEGGDLAGFMPSTQATVHGHLLFPDRHSKCLVNPHVRCPIIYKVTSSMSHSVHKTEKVLESFP